MTSESTSTTNYLEDESSASGTGGDLGIGDNCPSADPTAAHASANAIAQDWPEGPQLDATCEALAIIDMPFAVELSCVHPKSGEAVPVRINVGGNVGDRLDWLPGTTGLRLSFFKTPEDAPLCYACVDVSLRDVEGRLVLLSHSFRLLDAVPAEGAEFDMTGPAYLDPRSAEYQEFSAPFTSIQLQHVGCGTRDSIRPGGNVETPLAVEFAFDGGEILLYDRNVADTVAVGDEQLDIIVSDAFFRGEINCGDCPFTEASFLVLRAS